MKIKKLLGSLVAGTAMLAVAGIASAATTYEANLYGASAQFTFWNLQAVSYIQSQPGCSGATVRQPQFDSADQVNFATCGPNNNTYIIRVSSKASYDGILAVKGDNSLAGSEACTPTTYTDGGVAGNYRLMADETSCGTSGNSCSAQKCVRVNIGASDVAGESFTQTSSGTTNGPAGGAQLTMSFNGISTAGLKYIQPIVVPFQFWVHNDVTNSVSGTGTNKTMSNITRAMAVLLFSGEIAYWDQFGPNFPHLGVTLCLRHAGSGTAATLDYAVVKGNGWGGQLPTSENNPSVAATFSGAYPYIYFNNGTSAEEACVDTVSGAIGYFDADKIVGSTSGPGGTNMDGTNGVPKGYPNTRGIAYQGEYPTAESIGNSRYDFWTNEWAFWNSNDTEMTSGSFAYNFVNNASNAVPASEANFWMLQSNMNVEKTTDQAYLGE